MHVTWENISESFFFFLNFKNKTCVRVEQKNTVGLVCFYEQVQ